MTTGARKRTGAGARNYEKPGWYYWVMSERGAIILGLTLVALGSLIIVSFAYEPLQPLYQGIKNIVFAILAPLTPFGFLLMLKREPGQSDGYAEAAGLVVGTGLLGSKNPLD